MIQNISKDKVLEVVKQGPTLPNRIVKQVGGDTMIVGAILSTLMSTGSVLISSLKVGGSPLYYVPGHEAKLEEFLQHLNEKDQKTVKMLKEQKIMQDSMQDPLVRVSLRNIKDFAKPFNMQIGGKEEVFWRYYLVSKDDASGMADEMIKNHVPVLEQKAPEAPLQPKAEIAQSVDEIKSAPETQLVTEHAAEPAQKKEHKITHEHKPHKHTVHKEHHADDTVQDTVHEEKAPEKLRETPIEKVKDKSEFFDIIKEHAHKMNLDIISKEKIKKTEYTLILKNHDNNEYSYCMAKDKKTVNEGDLAAAYVYAQSKKMPCIFMTTGNLTKKAESMLTKEFKDLRLEKIDMIKY